MTKHNKNAKKYDPIKQVRESKFLKLHQTMQTLGGVDYFDLKELLTLNSEKNLFRKIMVSSLSLKLTNQRIKFYSCKIAYY